MAKATVEFDFVQRAGYGHCGSVTCHYIDGEYAGGTTACTPGRQQAEILEIAEKVAREIYEDESSEHYQGDCSFRDWMDSDSDSACFGKIMISNVRVDRHND